MSALKLLNVNRSGLEAALDTHPYLRIFAKDSWVEYAELTFQIQEAANRLGHRIEAAVVESIVRAYYENHDLVSLENKINQFVEMSLKELRTLHDFYDDGVRYFSITSNGKSLLDLFQTLLQGRIRYSAIGLDTVLTNLNLLLNQQREPSPEEAIQKLEKQREDIDHKIKDIQERGSEAVREQFKFYSAEELLSEAERAASDILMAGEDVKRDAIRAKEEVIAKYADKSFGPGHAIKASAEFNERLKQKPTFQSYQRTKDTLSYIEGIGDAYENKDIPGILHSLLDRQILDKKTLECSPLKGFAQGFERLNGEIDEEKKNHLKMLEIQVRMATSTDGRKVSEELRDLIGNTLKNKTHALAFFAENPLVYQIGIDTRFGNIELNSFNIPEKIKSQAPLLTEFNEGQLKAFAEAIRKSEELSATKAIKRIRDIIKVRGELLIKTHSFDDGFIEFCVAYCIDGFDPTIKVEVVSNELISAQINSPYGSYKAVQLKDKRLYLTAEEQ